MGGGHIATGNDPIALTVEAPPFPRTHMAPNARASLPPLRPLLFSQLPSLLLVFLLLLVPLPSLFSVSSNSVLASPQPQPLRALAHPRHGWMQESQEGALGRSMAERLGATASPAGPDVTLPSAGPESAEGGEGAGPALLSPEKFVDPLPRPAVVSGSQGPITLGMYATTQVSTTPAPTPRSPGKFIRACPAHCGRRRTA